MSESIIYYRIVHFHGYQCLKLRVNAAPEAHDFAIRCMNFSSHFERLTCHIKHSANILAR